MLREPDHEIAIIGAGLSGIGAAIALRRAGFEDFVILERGSGIGGTWRDNTYPGVGVDVPSQAYQFSYELKPDWSRTFAKGAEVMAYIDQCADRHDVRRFVRLDSEVTERVWDDDARLWQLKVAGAPLTARYVISAVGCFADPRPTSIAGVADFAGDLLHSASWDHWIDLTDKRVAIVGTGASAVQIIPEIAGKVAQLDVYQRTPIWVAPKADVSVPKPVQALLRRVPPVQNAVRVMTARLIELGLVNMVIDHDRFGRVTRAGAWLGENIWYRSQVRDRDVRRRLTPDYEPLCKRPAVSNQYLKTFNRANVELVTDSIERITSAGVQTIDGTQREVDALILATGFRMAHDPENFRRTPVRGREGFDLATFYEKNLAQSYEGVSMPGLPNHFMIFGPYGWTGGTWHALVETACTHIVRVLLEARRRDATAVEVRAEAAERWTRFAAERMRHSLWQRGHCASANSYYFDHHGDTTFLRPTTAREAWTAARTFPLDDYAFAGEMGDSPRSSAKSKPRVRVRPPLSPTSLTRARGQITRRLRA